MFAMQNLAIYRYTMGLNSNMNPIERGCAGTHILVVYVEFFYLISQCCDVWCYVYTLKGKYKRIYEVLRRYRYFKKLLWRLEYLSNIIISKDNKHVISTQHHVVLIHILCSFASALCTPEK